MTNSHRQVHPDLPPQPASIEILFLRYVVSLVKVLILRHRLREAYSSQPDSTQAPVSLDNLSGKKGKVRQKKDRMVEEPPFPILMLSCAMKRRICDVYADLRRAKLTDELVNEFVNCLIDARNELQQRYENVQRSFKIKKAMLSNHRNYRSSYESLFEQVCRLEIERDNLKKDAAIYNSLQERLQASVPYKLIMKLDAVEAEASEISFEELLAQEKEDTAFWQRNGKMRSVSSKVGK